MSLSVKNPNNWRLSGDLTFATVMRVDAQLKTALKENAPIEWLSIDLSTLEQIDSAGISLLLNTIHYCKLHNIKLQFVQLNSENAHQLLIIHGLGDIFSDFLATEIN